MKTFVVIPTYNECDNICPLAEQVLLQHESINILFVDDNSPDGTGELADKLAASEPRITVIHRCGKLGLGSAYRDGFKKALQLGADYIVEMDADFSHDPAILPLFLESIRSCDLVIGSRYLNGVSVVNWPIRRLILSVFASFYTRVITGLPIKDCTSGFKCFRRSTLEQVDLDSVASDGYAFQIEMNFLCMVKGMKLMEVPIIFIDRHAGSSKMSRKIVWEAVFLVWKLKLSWLWQQITKQGIR